LTNNNLNLTMITVAQVICTIVVILSKQYIIVQPQWIQDIICVVISCVASLSFVFVLVKAAVIFIWTKSNQKYYIGGKWFVVYHGNSATPSYIRAGTVNLKQCIDKVKMYNLLMCTPLIQDGAVIGLDNCTTPEHTSKQGISTGYGEYTIDFEPLILKGFFNLFRADNKSIMGLDICTIHLAVSPYKSPQVISGTFYNAERERDKKPTAGIIALFRRKEEAEVYIRKHIQ